MIEIKYNKFLEVTNMSPETFKATSIERKKKSLLKNGYKVLNIKGRGELATFYCEQTEDGVCKNEIKSILNIVSQHPKIMNIYLTMLLEDESVLDMSDLEVAQIMSEKINCELSTLKRYVCNCRKDLVRANWMRPIIVDLKDRNCSKRSYFIKFSNGQRKEITADEFFDNYNIFYYEKINQLKNKYTKSNNTLEIPKEVERLFKAEAYENMKNHIGGHMYVIYRKEFKFGGFEEGE